MFFIPLCQLLHNTMEVSDFKKFSDIEHVLERPVTYLGPIGLVTSKVWSLSPITGKAVLTDLTFQPPLEQIVLETATNCLDNVERTRKKNEESGSKVPIGHIEYVITDTTVMMYNEGVGIPVEKHPLEKVYVPEMIFFNLRSSSNYNDKDQRTWAGSNGLGVKLSCIFSKFFEVEICDPVRHVCYKQRSEDNMRTVHPPIITPYAGSIASARVTYEPDFHRFQLEKFSSEMIQMFAWQAASSSWTAKIPVHFNGTVMNYHDVSKYASLYCPEDNKNFLVYQDDSVELCLLDTPEKGFQASWINSMYTKRGGSHVNETLKIFTTGVMEKLNKKQKLFDVRDVKKHLSLIISCKVINPQFKTQAKDEFSHPTPKICIPEKTVKKVEKWDFVKQMSLYADIKARGEDKPDKKRRDKKVIVAKMEQANLIGTDAPCVLILTEGDSAKTFALRYRAAIPRGHDLYSVFPLRGKGLNIRNATALQLSDNNELKAVRNMLNVAPGTDYSLDQNFATLTHKGGVMYMTDADVDGDHITGLGLNLLVTPILHWLIVTMLPDFSLPSLASPRRGSVSSSCPRKSSRIGYNNNLLTV